METNMDTLPIHTPIWRRPAFWRDRAAEWRGPETRPSRKGVCYQLSWSIRGDKLIEAVKLLYKYMPDDAGLYFFPIGDRASRAALCDRIADDLEKGATGL